MVSKTVEDWKIAVSTRQLRETAAYAWPGKASMKRKKIIFSLPIFSPYSKELLSILWLIFPKALGVLGMR
jgi:hypothetical protein